MNAINFLPWRESKRQAEKKNLFRLALMLIFMGATLNGLYYYYTKSLFVKIVHNKRALAQDLGRLGKVQKEIRHLKTEKEALQASLGLLNAWKAKKCETVIILSNLKKIQTGTILFKEIKRRQNTLRLKAQAASAESLTAFIQRLKTRSFVSQQESVSYQLKEGSSTIQFLLDMQLTFGEGRGEQGGEV